MEADETSKLLRLAQDRGVRLVETFVVESSEEAARLGLAEDVDDYLAYEAKENYALVIHGTQPRKMKKKV
jgi:hypothetical protein